MSVLTPAEILIAARRLAGARPYLGAVAAIVHPEDLWQLCRDELTGVDARRVALKALLAVDLDDEPAEQDGDDQHG